jgi:hypothetical protein
MNPAKAIGTTSFFRLRGILGHAARSAVFGLACAMTAFALAACEDPAKPSEALDDLGPPGNGTSTGGGPRLDGGPTDEAGNPLDCYPNPTTHEEIINRCSDSERVEKAPSLPLLGPNGELPKLP